MSFKSVDGKTLDEWFDARFERKMLEREQAKTTMLSIMVTNGTLDWGYTTFIIASTAAALDLKVSLFFTFYGLNLLKKDLNPNISGLGNPAMPMKMPFGPDWFRKINMNIPNLVQANVPFFEKMATGMMKQTLKRKGVAPLADLREACCDLGVEMLACQMTVDLLVWIKTTFLWCYRVVRSSYLYRKSQSSRYNALYLKTDHANQPCEPRLRGLLLALDGLPLPSSRGGRPVCWVRIFLPVRRR